MSYSLWLVPHEDKVKSYLSHVVMDLANKYHGPEFEPHTTLLGDLPLTLDEITIGCEKLATKTKPFHVETGTVEYSTTYYQCIFARIKPTPQLMELYDVARRTFGLTEPSVFMPHTSLFYGNSTYPERHEIIKSLEFKPQTFSINSIVVTPGGENPPSEWKHLAKFQLKV